MARPFNACHSPFGIEALASALVIAPSAFELAGLTLGVEGRLALFRFAPTSLK
jgi:hypothetical protein